MGLDMYLTRRIFVGGEYDHRHAQGGVDIRVAGEHIVLPATKVSEIICPAGYWRKANHIHRWFVENVQNGIDECQEVYVSRDKLIELKTLCEEVLVSKDASLLPPQDGFFFGSTEIDEGYWQDLKDTIKILSELPNEGEYYYHASW